MFKELIGFKKIIELVATHCMSLAFFLRPLVEYDLLCKITSNIA